MAISRIDIDKDDNWCDQSRENKVEAAIPVLDPYKNTHSCNHERRKIGSMGYALGIVGIHVDNSYWWRGNYGD
jgi:hypothetical protein